MAAMFIRRQDLSLEFIQKAGEAWDRTHGCWFCKASGLTTIPWRQYDPVLRLLYSSLALHELEKIFILYYIVIFPGAAPVYTHPVFQYYPPVENGKFTFAAFDIHQSDYVKRPLVYPTEEEQFDNCDNDQTVEIDVNPIF